MFTTPHSPKNLIFIELWKPTLKIYFYWSQKKEKLAVKPMICWAAQGWGEAYSPNGPLRPSVCVCVCVCKLGSHKASHHPIAPHGRQLITPTKHIHTLYPSCHSAYSLPPLLPHQPADSTRPHPPGHGSRAILGFANHKLEKNTFINVLFSFQVQQYAYWFSLFLRAAANTIFCPEMISNLHQINIASIIPSIILCVNNSTNSINIPPIMMSSLSMDSGVNPVNSSTGGRTKSWTNRKVKQNWICVANR